MKFADGIKVANKRSLREGDYPELRGQDQYHHRGL